MGWPAIILCAIVLAASIKQIRDNRRRGVGVDWGKTLVSAVGAIVIAALATGAFYSAMALGALAVVVNRRWPGAKAP